MAYGETGATAFRLAYRARQFADALLGKPDEDSLNLALRVLNEPQRALFLKMPIAEQAHALRVFRRLWDAGHRDADLLAAALLHDVGKAMQRPRVWERVLWVVGRALFPRRAAVWGMGEPKGWKRAFVIAARHPEWSAHLVEGVGASPRAIALIREHHQSPKTAPADLLRLLQWADNQE